MTAVGAAPLFAIPALPAASISSDAALTTAVATMLSQLDGNSLVAGEALGRVPNW